MDNRQETLITSSEIDSQPYSTERSATQANDQTQHPQPSMLELNSMLLVVMSGLAALFIAAAFLLSHA